MLNPTSPNEHCWVHEISAPAIFHEPYLCIGQNDRLRAIKWPHLCQMVSPVPHLHEDHQPEHCGLYVDVRVCMHALGSFVDAAVLPLVWQSPVCGSRSR